MKKLSLTKQLLYICILIIGIIFIALGIILPNELLPIYEENIYNKLKQPLIFINNNSSNTINYDTDIAYIYIVNGEIKLTYNVNKVITNYSPEILKYITNDSGKFIYNLFVFAIVFHESVANEFGFGISLSAISVKYPGLLVPPSI